MTHRPATAEEAKRWYRDWEAKHQTFLRPAVDALRALGYIVDEVDTGCALVAQVDMSGKYSLQVVSAETMIELSGDDTPDWVVGVWDDNGDEVYMLAVPDAREAVRESLVVLADPKWRDPS